MRVHFSSIGSGSNRGLNTGWIDSFMGLTSSVPARLALGVTLQNGTSELLTSEPTF